MVRHAPGELRGSGSGWPRPGWRHGLATVSQSCRWARRIRSIRRKALGREFCESCESCEPVSGNGWGSGPPDRAFRRPGARPPVVRTVRRREGRRDFPDVSAISAKSAKRPSGQNFANSANFADRFQRADRALAAWRLMLEEPRSRSIRWLITAFHSPRVAASTDLRRQSPHGGSSINCTLPAPRPGTFASSVPTRPSPGSPPPP
jgi:hypothetical protein